MIKINKMEEDKKVAVELNETFNFKTLVFTDERKTNGRFAHFGIWDDSNWLCGNVPLVLMPDVTIEELEEIYEEYDFNGIELINIQINFED